MPKRRARRRKREQYQPPTVDQLLSLMVGPDQDGHLEHFKSLEQARAMWERERAELAAEENPEQVGSWWCAQEWGLGSEE